MMVMILAVIRCVEDRLSPANHNLKFQNSASLAGPLTTRASTAVPEYTNTKNPRLAARRLGRRMFQTGE